MSEANVDLDYDYEIEKRDQKIIELEQRLSNVDNLPKMEQEQKKKRIIELPLNENDGEDDCCDTCSDIITMIFRC